MANSWFAFKGLAAGNRCKSNFFVRRLANDGQARSPKAAAETPNGGRVAPAAA
jgi:hypothetical protein